jgi:hypothetical protein
VLTFVMAASGAMGLLLVFLYIFLIRNTTGTMRKNTIIGMIGQIVLVVAVVVDGQFVLSNPVVPFVIKMYVSPLVAMLGVLLILASRKEV